MLSVSPMERPAMKIKSQCPSGARRDAQGLAGHREHLCRQRRKHRRAARVLERDSDVLWSKYSTALLLDFLIA